MNLIVDTHALLWFINGDISLSQRARTLIEDPQHNKFISVASLWEIAIKVSAEKLKIGLSITDLANTHIERNGMMLLPIQSSHLDVLSSLQFHHRDPFDRLIIAQSIAEGYQIVSTDSAFDAYPVARLW